MKRKKKKRLLKQKDANLRAQNSEEIASFLLKSEATGEESFVRRDLDSPAVGVTAHSAPSGGGLSFRVVLVFDSFCLSGSPIIPSRPRGQGLDSDFE